MKIFQVIFIFFIVTFSSCVSTGMYTSSYDSDFIFESEGYSYLPAMVFSPDSNYIAISGVGRAFLYNVSTSVKEKIFTSEGYAYLPALVFSPNGQSIAISGIGKVLLNLL